jgi:Rieske Fe-S protein
MANDIQMDPTLDDSHPSPTNGRTRREAITALVGVAIAGAASCLGCHSNGAAGQSPVGGGPVAGAAPNGALGSITTLKASKVPVAVTVDNAQAFVSFTGGTPKVISAICPHKGCVVAFDTTQQQFICPCHHSVFGADGTFVSGVANAPLPTIPSHVSGDTLYANS